MIDKYLNALSRGTEDDQISAIKPICNYMIDNNCILTRTGDVYDLVPREEFDASFAENTDGAWEIRNEHFVYLRNLKC